MHDSLTTYMNFVPFITIAPVHVHQLSVLTAEAVKGHNVKPSAGRTQQPVKHDSPFIQNRDSSWKDG